MCLQTNSLFTCGHRCFKNFDNCSQFGITCLGAGPNHRNEAVPTVCRDCRAWEKPRQSTPSEGGSPFSNGEGAGERKDPWGKGDPWKTRK